MSYAWCQNWSNFISVITYTALACNSSAAALNFCLIFLQYQVFSLYRHKVRSWGIMLRVVSRSWRWKCRSWASDYSMKIHELFDARHGVKKRCQTWHRIIQSWDNSMPCLASFFEAMFGFKKLPHFLQSINCPTSAFEPSYIVTHESLHLWSSIQRRDLHGNVI